MVRTAKLLLPLVTGLVLSGCFLELGGLVDPSFRISPSGRHFTGDVLTFTQNASCFSDLYSIQWDLDGDGRLDKDELSCDDHSITHSYANPGTYTVTDTAGAKGLFGNWIWAFSSQQVTIEARPLPDGNRAPSAAFSSDANPGYTERPVHFDASTSNDPDGQVVKYEWDFTSDGTWDATGPTATYAFPAPGDYQTTLRVTDDRGATGTAQRAIPVVDGVPPSESLSAAGTASAARATRFKSTLSGRVTQTGQGYINRGTLSHVGLSAHGSMKLKGLPKPLERKRRARWSARLTTKQRGSSRTAHLAAQGFLLLDFGHRDRVCLSGVVSGRIDKPIAGRLAVVGGTGLGRRLRGRARLHVPARGRTVTGTLAFGRTGKARKLPKACRPLLRSR